MDSNVTTAEMNSLLSHGDWVRDLARKLVRDPDLAEDLAQETLLAALKTGTGTIRSTRAWLGGVMRKLLWERIRQDGRRRARETKAANAEAMPSTLEIHERMTAHRAVVDTLLGLPEHYREVLMRRYFEGETPTRIAKQLQCPISTVKTRLARGLDLMRKQLDDRHGGDGKSWLGAIAPLLRAPAPAPVLAPAARRFAWVGGAVATLAVTSWLTLGLLDGTRESAGSVAPGEVSLRTDAAAADESLPSDIVDREVLPTELAELADNQLNLTPAPLSGRVYWADGSRASGQLVRLQPRKDCFVKGAGSAIALSRANGAFRMERARGAGLVKAGSAGVATVIAGLANGSDVRDGLAVVVARAIEVGGTVTDDTGTPLGQARVELLPPGGFLGRFGSLLQSSAQLRFLARTDAAGRFRFAAAPRVAGSTLRVEREGFEPRTTPAPEHDDTAVVIQLDRPTPGPGVLEGEVLGPEGRAVADARVSCGLSVTRTDSNGVFRLDVTERNARGVRGSRLVAIKPGFRPAILEARAGADGEPEWPPKVRLQLDGPPLHIAGAVLDEADRPIEGARVWITDPTLLSQPRRDRRTSFETSGYVDAETAHDWPEVVESVLAGEPDDVWRFATTDRDGRFELDGLADRDYRIAAMEATTLLCNVVTARAGAGDLAIVLDPAGSVPRVEGRVVGADGQPVAGVRVNPQRTVLRLTFGPHGIFSQSKNGEGMLTGPDGRFWLRDVPRHGIALRLSSHHIVPVAQPFVPDHPLEIRVVRRVDLQVVGASRDVEVGVQDRGGADVTIGILVGQTRYRAARAPVRDGHSAVLSVPETAAVLTVYDGDRATRRIPLSLSPGRLTRVQL